MSEQKHTRKIVVTEQRQIHKGTNNAGREYTIWQVIATKETGEPIPEGMNLRSFEELPKNQLIEVEVERYVSQQYGTSFTVSLKGKKRGAGLGKQVDSLRAELKSVVARLERLEQAVQHGGARAAAPAAAQPTAGPPQVAPTQPPPAPAPSADGMPGDDIPF